MKREGGDGCAVAGERLVVEDWGGGKEGERVTNKPVWVEWFSCPMLRVTDELLGTWWELLAMSWVRGEGRLTVTSKPYVKSRSAASRNPAMS